MTKLKKNTLEMAPLGVKACRESEFDIFEAKKRCADPGKACVMKRKVVKIAFFNFPPIGLVLKI